MTIRTLDIGDVILSERIGLYDPHQLGLPCWMQRVWNLLPPETIRTVDKGEYSAMAIRVIAEKEAPERLFKRGTVSSKQDYSDVMSALRTLKDGQAMVVAMDAEAWNGVKKPETTFASNLRRYFESKNLTVTAYQSGNMEITVRKATALDAKKKKKK